MLCVTVTVSEKHCLKIQTNLIQREWETTQHTDEAERVLRVTEYIPMSMYRSEVWSQSDQYWLKLSNKKWKISKHLMFEEACPMSIPLYHCLPKKHLSPYLQRMKSILRYSGRNLNKKLRCASLIYTIWDLARSTEISQDLLRSHKVYWDLTRFTGISQDFDISHAIWFYILKTFIIFLKEKNFLQIQIITQWQNNIYCKDVNSK